MRTQHVGWLLGDFRRSLVRAKRVKRVDIIRSELTRTVSFHLWQLAWRPTHSNVECRACFEFRLVGNRCNHTNSVLVRSATIRRARSASSDNPGARRHCQQPAVAAISSPNLCPALLWQLRYRARCMRGFRKMKCMVSISPNLFQSVQAWEAPSNSLCTPSARSCWSYRPYG